MKVIYTFIFGLTLIFTLAAQSANLMLIKTDFASAEVALNGKLIVVRGTLNESGVKKIHAPGNKGSEVTINIGGEAMTLKNRSPILGKGIEFGPFSEEVARNIVLEINRQ